MINIAICDDDKVILSEIKNLLLNIAEKNFIKIDVNTYYDGSSLEKDINKGEVFDLLYLDIEMSQNVQIPLHRITDSASNGSVFPVVTEHFSASSDHAFL